MNLLHEFSAMAGRFRQTAPDDGLSGRHVVGRLLERVHRWLAHTEFAVLVREMRARHRGMVPFLVMFCYLAILAISVLVVVSSISSPPGAWTPGYHAYDAGTIGRRIFGVVSLLQLAMVCLIVPAYSAGAITEERAKGTFDLLSLTLLTSGEILHQKLLVSVGEVAMMVFASIPVTAIVFMFGGVSPLELVSVYMVLLLTAGAIGALGMACSCHLGNTRSSTFAAYLAMFIYMVGIPVSFLWLGWVSRTGFSTSVSAYPLMFTLMFAFVGAVFSLIVFGVLTLALKRRVALWRTRAFRMGVFGATYAVLMMVMSNDALLASLISVSYGFDTQVPLVLFTNPFAAIHLLTSSVGNSIAAGGSPSPSASLTAQVTCATLAFCTASIYFLQRLSLFRFGTLRGSSAQG